MKKCIKCGFEKEVDEFETCDKCGAVQSKSIKYLEGKKIETAEGIDKVLLDLKKLNDEFSQLEKEIQEDGEYDSQTKSEIVKSISEAKDGIEKTSNNLTNLKKHVLSFVVDYEINVKLKKTHEYIVSFENEYLELRRKYVGLSTRPTKQGVALNNNVNGSDFSRPEVSPSVYENIQDIEFSLSVTKYPALSGLAGIYKVLAYLVMGLSLLVAVSILAINNSSVGVLGVSIGSKLAASFLTLLSGGVIGLTLLAISESIKVLLDIECNSRAVRDYTKALFLGKSGEGSRIGK